MSRTFFPLAFSVLLAGVIPSSTALPASELDAVLARMEQAEKDVQSLKFRFTQNAHLRVTGEEQKIRGEASFRRPDKFRVEHTAPRGQTVISDGKNLWLYNPAQKQVIMDTWTNWAKSAGFPKGLLPFQMNPTELRKRYNFVLESKVKRVKSEEYVLRLDPIDPGPWPYKIRLWIDSKSGLPMRTELDSQSVQTVTEISHVKINPDLSEDLFSFKPPKGVEVLKSPFE